MQIWKFIKKKLDANIAVALLYVLQSTGSSPGRQGFKMAIAIDEKMIGSIGGGIMEHKLVEKAKNMLRQNEIAPFFKHQIHNKKSPTNQSGMICSGEQTIVIYPIVGSSKISIQQLWEQVSTNKKITLVLNPQSITINTEAIDQQFLYSYHSPNDWLYQENIAYQNTIYIIGGGHVSLALSKMMSTLGFYVKVFDDRNNLSTLTQNTFANETNVINYKNIAQYIPAGKNHYVVIMTFGYRPDKVVLQELLDKEFAFIGMMGSDAKIKQLYQEYLTEGISTEQLAHVHAPIGLAIFSKTPDEIAISIAAQIIQIKNEHLPTGRSK